MRNQEVESSFFGLAATRQLSITASTATLTAPQVDSSSPPLSSESSRLDPVVNPSDAFADSERAALSPPHRISRDSSDSPRISRDSSDSPRISRDSSDSPRISRDSSDSPKSKKSSSPVDREDVNDVKPNHTAHTPPLSHTAHTPPLKRGKSIEAAAVACYVLQRHLDPDADHCSIADTATKPDADDAEEAQRPIKSHSPLANLNSSPGERSCVSTITFETSAPHLFVSSLGGSPSEIKRAKFCRGAAGKRHRLSLDTCRPKLNPRANTCCSNAPLENHSTPYEAKRRRLSLPLVSTTKASELHTGFRSCKEVKYPRAIPPDIRQGLPSTAELLKQLPVPKLKKSQLVVVGSHAAAISQAVHKPKSPARQGVLKKNGFLNDEVVAAAADLADCSGAVAKQRIDASAVCESDDGAAGHQINTDSKQSPPTATSPSGDPPLSSTESSQTPGPSSVSDSEGSQLFFSELSGGLPPLTAKGRPSTIMGICPSRTSVVKPHRPSSPSASTTADTVIDTAEPPGVSEGYQCPTSRAVSPSDSLYVDHFEDDEVLLKRAPPPHRHQEDALHCEALESREVNSTAASIGRKSNADRRRCGPIIPRCGRRRRRRLSVSASQGAAEEFGDTTRGAGVIDGAPLGSLSSACDQEGPTSRRARSRSSAMQSPCRGRRSGFVSKRGLSRMSRLSVSGAPSTETQREFENKELAVRFWAFDGESASDCRTSKVTQDNKHAADLLGKLGVGYACKKGLKPDSPNQDDFCIVRNEDWSMYAVFDGHGPSGHDVSNFVRRELPRLLCNHKHFESDLRKAFRSSFLAVHRLVQKASKGGKAFDTAVSGCTATVVVFRPSKTDKDEGTLHVAHVGDSRAVMGRKADSPMSEIDGPSSPRTARGYATVALTIDHKPNNAAELPRIINSGGQVRRLDGDIPHRVFIKGQLHPGLAMSRAIGDAVATQAGVICEPDVSEFRVKYGQQAFVLLCSDGVWEFISSQEAVEIVGDRFALGQDVQQVANELALESWNRWIAEEGSVVDDITAQVIHLDTHFRQPLD